MNQNIASLDQTSANKKDYPDYTTGKTDLELIGHIGFGSPVVIDKTARKRVLITGAGSYIGQCFQKYAKEHYDSNFIIDTLDMHEASWKEHDFSQYDIVYHVAGIAHADVGNVSDEIKRHYYDVNTTLAIETAKKAKSDGVQTFIFMSSMIVYGDSAPYGKVKVVDENTVPHPANFYGDSKLQADVGVRNLADDSFQVIVLRPPMIYGRGSKGNYPTLAKLAKKLPLFPNVKNERSMLYIENLCEFLCQIMLVSDETIMESDKIANVYNKNKNNAFVFMPQNSIWSNTSDMVQMIASASGKHISKLALLNFSVAIASKIPGKISQLANKAFGNSCYAHEISDYPGIDYQKIELKESIFLTEGNIEYGQAK